jgi:hypothetical protein
MTRRTRLPGGELRKASQRREKLTAPARVAVAVAPRWRPGDAVRWKNYAGQFLQLADDDEHVVILIGQRRWRVPGRELLPG